MTFADDRPAPVVRSPEPAGVASAGGRPGSSNDAADHANDDVSPPQVGVVHRMGGDTFRVDYAGATTAREVTARVAAVTGTRVESIRLVVMSSTSVLVDQPTVDTRELALAIINPPSLPFLDCSSEGRRRIALVVLRCVGRWQQPDANAINAFALACKTTHRWYYTRFDGE